MEHVSQMWGNLSKSQLKRFARILDMAEHFAMSEYSKADEVPWRNKWAFEVKELAAMQSEIREMVEKAGIESGVM
jgi:hypothetical protein